MTSQSRPGERAGSAVGPRPRLKVGGREVLLSLAVIAVGLFLATAMMSNPAGHALRRMGTAGGALVLGLVGIGLSVGRACSGCGGWLRKLSIGGSHRTLATLQQALSDGDGPATERALGRGGRGEGAEGPESAERADGASDEASGGIASGGGVAARGGAGAGAGSLDVAFCEGCRLLVSWRLRLAGASVGAGAASKEPQTVSGPAAREVTLVLSTYRAQQQEPAP